MPLPAPAPSPLGRALAVLLVALVAWAAPSAGAADGAVHILFFSSPHCPFCGIVADRDLAPLRDRHGASLQVRVIDTSTPGGAAALQTLWEQRDLPAARRGVPTVVIGDRVLVGAREIPEQLPDLIARARAAGGAPAPELPGLDTLPTQPSPEPPAPDGWTHRIARDVPGNYVALALLGAMLALGAASVPAARWQIRLSDATPFAAKVAVALIGLGAAAYLSWGELTERDLVCGPLGQCNVVQHSDMASLWGLFPIAPLGLMAYVALLAVYAVGAVGPAPLARWAPVAALGLAGSGFAFSIVLTFWQPVMIGATCAWCLLSAVSMTASFAIGLGAGRRRIADLLGPAGGAGGGPPLQT
jgi:uncharacterized membrane protein